MNRRRTKCRNCLLLPVALLTLAGPMPSAADTPQLVQSRAIAMDFSRQLQTALKTALGEDGATSAVSVCKDVAPQIASNLSRESGAKVARVSLRYRNSANSPEPWQVAALQEFEQLSRAGVRDSPLEFFEAGDSKSPTRYLMAVRVAPPCLVCHGTAIPDELQTAIDTHYPFDLARGYVSGDVRGAISVTWPISVESTGSQ